MLILKGKAHAGAMLFAVAIAFVLALICSGFILFYYWHVTYVNQFEIQHRLLVNANSGINVLLGKEEPVSQEVDLYGQGTDSVGLQRFAWGIYDVVVSKAHFKEHAITQSVLIGQKSKEQSLALYLADANMPLIVCGDTKIKGDCYLPQNGIKPGSVNGNLFQHDKLMEGEIKRSADSLPALVQRTVQRNIRMFQQSHRSIMSSIEIRIQNGDSITNSFADTLLMMNSREKIMLDRVYAKGYIIICSSKSVQVTKNAHLEDILIYAPKIVIEDDVTGNFQSYAYDTLLIGKNCDLAYPSACVLTYIDSQSVSNPLMKIGEKSRVAGTVIGYCPQKAYLRMNYVAAENSLVKGTIYWKGTMNLYRSKLTGPVYCSRFFMQASMGSYTDYLNDVSIDRSLLPKAYLDGLIEKETKQEGIARWLY